MDEIRLNMKNHHDSLAALIGFVLLLWLPVAPAQTLPPLAKQLNPAETTLEERQIFHRIVFSIEGPQG